MKGHYPCQTISMPFRILSLVVNQEGSQRASREANQEAYFLGIQFSLTNYSSRCSRMRRSSMKLMITSPQVPLLGTITPMPRMHTWSNRGKPVACNIMEPRGAAKAQLHLPCSINKGARTTSILRTVPSPSSFVKAERVAYSTRRNRTNWWKEI